MSDHISFNSLHNLLAIHILSVFRLNLNIEANEAAKFSLELQAAEGIKNTLRAPECFLKKCLCSYKKNLVSRNITNNFIYTPSLVYN